MKDLVWNNYLNCHSKKSGYLPLCLLVLLLISVTFVLDAEAEGQDNNSIDEWIELLEAVESQVKLVEYDVKGERSLASSEDGLDTLKSAGPFWQVHILVESGTGRVYKDREGLDGTLDYKPGMTLRSVRPVYVASRRLHSFDGQIAMQMTMRSTKGAKLGDYRKPRGQIDSKPILGVVDYEDNGLNMIYPNFYMGKGLADAVRQSEESRFIENPDATLEVHYLEKRALPGRTNDLWKKVVLDLAKNGIISQIVDYVKKPDDLNEYRPHSIG